MTDDEPGEWAVSEPLTLALVEDETEAIRYDGVWSEARHEAYAEDDVRFSDDNGSRARISFTGAGISWRGPVGPLRGRADVIVDGDEAATVDTGAGQFVPVNNLFSISWPGSGEHDLQIVVAGTDGRPNVAIDAFYVLEPTGQ